MKPKVKKILKLAAKWEAANIALWYLMGKPQNPNGKAKSLSLLLNAFDSVKQSQSIQQLPGIIPTANAMTLSTKKPVGLIMWDGFHTDYSKDIRPRYDLRINEAIKARVKVSRLKEAGIYNVLPFYGRNISPQTVEINQNASLSTHTVTVDWTYNQAAMDAQIRYAAKAGFSYLAFCHYAKESPVSEGRQMFVNSTQKGNMKMCFIDPNLGNNPTQSINDIVAAMKAPYYQKINGKPLIYATEAKMAVINQIRSAYGGELYIVGLNNDLYSLPTNLSGINAGSQYFVPGYGFGSNHEYSGVMAQMADNANKFQTQNGNIRYVPNITTAFNNYQKLNPLERDGWATPATDQQLIQSILLFNQLMSSARVDTGLAYAGNEYVENGGRSVFPTFDRNGQLDFSTMNIFGKYLMK
jgi:hypothetical protein